MGHRSLRLRRFRWALLAGVCRDPIAYRLPPMHILTLDTIMLRVGIACGIIKVAGK
jgi:hypothetical protein